MEKQRIENILELASAEEKAIVGTIYNAALNNLKVYQADNTATKLKDWQAADAELVRIIEKLENKYLTGAKQFKNIMAALRFLKDQGWKVGKDTLYNAKKAGILVINEDNSIDETVILAYAAKYLQKTKAANDADTIGHLSEDLAGEKLTRAKLMNQKLQFEADKEKGKYILKDRWLAELVSKLSASKHVAVKVARMKAPDLIAAVGGNLKKESLFVEMFINYIEAGYNELAKVPELKFLVKE